MHRAGTQDPQALELPFVLPQRLGPELPGACVVQTARVPGWHRTLPSVERALDHLCPGRYLVKFSLARRKVSYPATWKMAGGRGLPSHRSGPLSVTQRNTCRQGRQPAPVGLGRSIAVASCPSVLSSSLCCGHDSGLQRTDGETEVQRGEHLTPCWDLCPGSCAPRMISRLESCGEGGGSPS